MTELNQTDIDEILQDQSEQIWQCVKEDADAALAINPKDETAQSQLLKYENWKRRQSTPRAKSGVVIIKQPRTQNVAGDWIVFVRKAKVGDYVLLKKSNGTAKRVRLLEEVGPNEWRV